MSPSTSPIAESDRTCTVTASSSCGAAQPLAARTFLGRWLGRRAGHKQSKRSRQSDCQHLYMSGIAQSFTVAGTAAAQEPRSGNPCWSAGIDFGLRGCQRHLLFAPHGLTQRAFNELLLHVDNVQSGRLRTGQTQEVHLGCTRLAMKPLKSPPPSIKPIKSKPRASLNLAAMSEHAWF